MGTWATVAAALGGIDRLVIPVLEQYATGTDTQRCFVHWAATERAVVSTTWAEALGHALLSDANVASEALSALVAADVAAGPAINEMIAFSAGSTAERDARELALLHVLSIALWATVDEGGRNSLLTLAKTSDDWAMRLHAACALALSGDVRAVPPLAAAMRDAEPGGNADDVVQNASFALTALGPDGSVAVPVLADALDRVEGWPAHSVCIALREIGHLDAHARSALVRATERKDHVVATMAAAALARDGYSDGLPVMLRSADLADPLVRVASLCGLSYLTDSSEDAASIVRSAIDDEDPEVRRWAAFGLARMGDDSGADTLLTVALYDYDPQASEAAVALAQLGRAEGRERLDELADSPSWLHRARASELGKGLPQ